MADPTDTDETASVTDDTDTALLKKLKRWFERDREHTADWRKEAEEDYAFVAGDQWKQTDVDTLKDQLRPVITFNRVDPLIRSVAGEQINNAQEVRFFAREEGDAKANDLLTNAAEWFRDQCDADDEESDAFWDAAVCGIGWTDSRLDADSDPSEPMPAIERVDPLEVYYDCNARKRNLSDARRLWRVRTMPQDGAALLFPDAAKSDLDAGWARDDGTGKEIKDDRRTRYDPDEDDDATDDDTEVTIVQCQWWEMEPYYKVAVPPQLAMNMPEVGTDGTLEMSVDEYDGIKDKLEALAGGPLQSVKLSRRVFKQAFIGRTFLKPPGPTPCPDHFSLNCITAFRDRNKGTFYGLVRAMKDPQRWANKWLSQALHIMNSNAKGGVMIETDAVDDARKFEESFADPIAVTWVPPGSLSGDKIKPKPVAQFPAGFYQLMEFAISSVRDVAGINLEMMGMREANQPASLEYQRRQAGVTILAQLFRSMRRYHRNQGKVLLYYIQHYLSDGRLIRIIGEEGAKYVPLMKADKANVKYDIIVDEGPSSPNQKERVWSLIGDRFWDLPPEIQLAVMKYSPFPESVVEEVKQAAQKASQGPQAQMAQRMAELEMGLKQIEGMLKQAQTAKVQAETAKIGSEIGQPGAPQPDPNIEHAYRMHELQATTETSRMKIAADAQTAAQKTATDAQVKTAKIASDQAVQRERTASDRLTELDWMANADRTSARKGVIDAGVKIATAQIAAKNRPKPSTAAKRPGGQ